MMRNSGFSLLIFGAMGFKAAFSQVITLENRIDYIHTSVAIETKIFTPNYFGIVFINLHDDENSGVEAGEAYLNEKGGKMVQLKHFGERNIYLNPASAKIFFDPNRIFTPAGIKETLKKRGKHYTPGAKKVEAFAKEILKTTLPGVKLIVSLHNNTDSFFSIESYQPPNMESINALALYRNPLMDSDDFVYTTVPAIFDFLKEKVINVVLQNNSTAIDDGSLSIYAGRNNLHYINIEAQHGHYNEQLRMLTILSEVFEQYKN